MKILKKENINFKPTNKDFVISAGLSNFNRIFPTIKKTGCNPKRILDMGCGYGAMLKILGEYFKTEEIYGIDMDDGRLEVAKGRVKALKFDLENKKIPLKDGFFDLIISIGAIEHMAFYDNMLKETKRLLSVDGFFLLSFPNLRSWTNLGSLLLGFQPPDIEVSKECRKGVHKGFCNHPVGHIHSTTLNCMVGLLDFHGFKIVDVQWHITTNKTNPLIDFMDRVLPFGFKRRYLLVCKRK